MAFKMKGYQAHGKSPMQKNGLWSKIKSKASKAKEYIKLCKDIGGCKILWNTCCTDRSVDYPKHFPTPFDVSAVHESIWR